MSQCMNCKKAVTVGKVVCPECAQEVERLRADLAHKEDQLREALKEKAERDRMQCINCCFKDMELCRAVWKTKYDLKKEKWQYKTMMEDDGFCSRFEPKEEIRWTKTI